MSDEKFQIGDKVVFQHPDFEDEVLTLKESWVSVGGHKCWHVEENSEYLYQEKFLRKLTKLDKALK